VSPGYARRSRETRQRDTHFLGPNMNEI